MVAWMISLIADHITFDTGLKGGWEYSQMSICWIPRWGLAMHYSVSYSVKHFMHTTYLLKKSSKFSNEYKVPGHGWQNVFKRMSSIDWNTWKNNFKHFETNSNVLSAFLNEYF